MFWIATVIRVESRCVAMANHVHRSFRLSNANRANRSDNESRSVERRRSIDRRSSGEYSRRVELLLLLHAICHVANIDVTVEFNEPTRNLSRDTMSQQQTPIACFWLVVERCRRKGDDDIRSTRKQQTTSEKREQMIRSSGDALQQMFEMMFARY
jgi:hypothetical protein